MMDIQEFYQKYKYDLSLSHQQFWLYLQVENI